MFSYVSQFPHGLMFHRFHHQGSSPSGQGSLTSGDFERILCFAGMENILSPQEWVFRLKHNNLRDRDLCITLDDGLKCQYDICLPVLKKYNLKAFWFVYSCVFEGKVVESEIYNYFAANFFCNMDDFFELFLSKCGGPILNRLKEHRFKKYSGEMRVLFPFYSDHDLKFRFIRNEVLPGERFKNIMEKIMKEKGAGAAEIAAHLWLSDVELRILSETGHCIGLHSYDHPFALSKLSYEQQCAQYIKNYDHVRKICHKEIIAMSHPLNSYNQDTLTILDELGILCGFRSNMTPPHGKNMNPGHFEMAREDSANIKKELSNG